MKPCKFTVAQNSRMLTVLRKYGFVSGDVGPLVTCLTDKARYYLDVHYLIYIVEGGRQIIAN